MLKRQRQGSVLCPSCRQLVGVNDKVCFHCGRTRPGMLGFAKYMRWLGDENWFLQFILIGCVGLFVISLIMDVNQIGFNGLMGFLSPGGESLAILGASGAYPVFTLNRWWTVLSAAFLHGGLLHIGFNLYWVRMLYPAVAMFYQGPQSILIYTAASFLGFAMSSLMGWLLPGVPFVGGAQFTVGASAPIFGLLGALVLAGGSVGSQAKFYAILMGGLGLILPLVDNWAHAGGFFGGYLMARYLNSYRGRQRNYYNLSLVCVGAFGLSILVSVGHALIIINS